jgi:hypothetical protein
MSSARTLSFPSSWKHIISRHHAVTNVAFKRAAALDKDRVVVAHSVWGDASYAFRGQHMLRWLACGHWLLGLPKHLHGMPEQRAALNHGLPLLRRRTAMRRTVRCDQLALSSTGSVKAFFPHVRHTRKITHQAGP